MQDRAFNMCMLVLLQSFLETGYTCSLSLLLPRMKRYRPVLLHSANSGEFRVVWNLNYQRSAVTAVNIA